MVYSKVETNHMQLAMQLYERITFVVGTPATKTTAALCLPAEEWRPRAAHDARELILARRALIRVIEAEYDVVDDYNRIIERVRNILTPYGIELAPNPDSLQCLFLKLPNGDSNEPTGKCWLVPS